MKEKLSKYSDMINMLLIYVSVTYVILIPRIPNERACLYVIPQCLSLAFLPANNARVTSFYWATAAILHLMFAVPFMTSMKYYPIEPESYGREYFIMFISYIYSAYFCFWCRGMDYELLIITTTFLRIIILTLPYISDTVNTDAITAAPIKDAIVVSLLIDTFASKLMSYIKKQRLTNETRGS